jgi:hypothetical protein
MKWLLLIGIALFLIFILLYRKVSNYNQEITYTNFWHNDDDNTTEKFFQRLFKGIDGIINIYGIYGPTENIPKIKTTNEINVFVDTERSDYNNAKLYINNNSSKYDIILSTARDKGNIITCPDIAIYMGRHNLWDKCLTKRTFKKKTKFCLFVYSNGGGEIRNQFFKKLSEYKEIDSGGKFMRNIDNVPDKYYSQEYFDFISDYKFMICFESKGDNDYFVTEKLPNAYLGGAIPIYWGGAKVLEWFNPNSFLYLDDETHMDQLVNKIKELDQDDNMYENFFNQKLTEKIPVDIDEDVISKKISTYLNEKSSP